MSGFLVAVTWISVVGSSGAIILGIRATLKLTSWAGSPWLRLALIATSLIALCYLLSYWWLLMHQDKFLEWAEVTITLKMVGWFIGPWIVLPVSLEHHIQKRAVEMRVKADQLLEEVRYETRSDDS